MISVIYPVLVVLNIGLFCFYAAKDSWTIAFVWLLCAFINGNIWAREGWR